MMLSNVSLRLFSFDICCIRKHLYLYLLTQQPLRHTHTSHNVSGHTMHCKKKKKKLQSTI